MVNLLDLTQARAFARQDGAILGAVWIVSFVCTMLATSPEDVALSLFANLLTLSTPFVVAFRLKHFRDTALEGVISFRRGLFYCVQTFFNATLLLTVVQYLWFRFLDTSALMAGLQENYQIVAESYKMSAYQVQTLLDAFLQMRPIAWAAMFMITELFVGGVLSPIIAVIMMRKAKAQHNP